jgi:hypothetical protein
MSKTNPKPPPPDIDMLLQRHILARARGISGKLLARLATAADDLDAGNGLAALGGLDGIEREIQTLRSFLLLLP